MTVRISAAPKLLLPYTNAPSTAAKVESIAGYGFTDSGRVLLTAKTQERENDVTISEFNLGARRGEREELILQYWEQLDMEKNPDKAEEENRDHRTAITGKNTYHLQDIVNHHRPTRGRWKGKLVFDVTYQGYSHNEIDQKTMDKAFAMRPKLVARYCREKGIALSRKYTDLLQNNPDTSDDNDETGDEMAKDKHQDEADEELNHSQDGEDEDAMEEEAGATKDIVEVPDSQAQGEERMEGNESGATKDIVEVPDSQAQANRS